MNNTDTTLDNQPVTATIAATDAQGQPVPFQFDGSPANPPVWGAVPAAGLTLAPSSDNTSCLITPSTPGVYSISLSGSVGGNPVSAQGTLTVTPGAPINFVMNFAPAPAAPSAPAAAPSSP